MNDSVTMNRLSIHGFELYFQTIGEGEPLLILHGFTGSGAELVKLFGDMSNKYKLIIPDLRGHGHSTNPSKEFTFKQNALDMIALLIHLKIERCKAIGFSGGGCILLQMAYAEPGLISAMVLVSATSHFPESTSVIMKQYARSEKTEEQWKALRQIHVHGDEQIKLLFEYAAKFGDDPNDMNLTPNMLSSIKSSALIVQGDNDYFYPLSVTIELYQSLPNAHLWIVPISGHGPINADNIALFKGIVVQHFILTGHLSPNKQD